MLEKTLESLLDFKEIKSVSPKGNQPWVLTERTWYWSWSSNTLAIWCEELTHWKRPWCWEGLGAGKEGDDRGWDGWMPSPTWWTWLWVNSGSWWWTGRPGVLIHGVAKSRTWLSDRTELNWTEPNWTTRPLTQVFCSFHQHGTIMSQNALGIQR